MGKVVTAAVAVIKGGDGLQRYYYQGSTLPDELPKDEVQRLVDDGMVGDEEALVAQPGDEPGVPNIEVARREADAPQREAKTSRQSTAKNG
ncbi:hypothetical protein OG989_04110 [Micromonospora sp. NBC_01740]|uniref:hypothetical protein n=1 Tax=Micromonospora sp. NBC_01740 TaxID=2975986 RepID=UPI002E12E272|nr:hypothetical protein OG989_04110 [Micromonospora sp. NBC_01740]